MRDVFEWIAWRKRRIHDDQDWRILLTGPPGVGKSTCAMQIGRQVDPGMGLANIFWDIPTFIQTAGDFAPGEVVWLDEARIRNRRGMHGTSIDLLDWLEENRAGRHVVLICYPENGSIDPGIPPLMHDHIRITRQGHAEARSREMVYGYDGSETVTWPLACLPWTFRENKGPLWEAYRVAKLASIGRNARAKFDAGPAWVAEDLRGLVGEDEKRPRL